MSHNNNISRREFIKLGGLAAISLPTISETRRVGQYSLNISSEEYGGFLIRKNFPDHPPYEVDETIYQRFDAKNSALGHSAEQKFFVDQHSDEQLIASEQPGFQKEDFSLHVAGWTVAMH